MGTQAQIDANRQNSKKSTGPKTAKGKANVARNAIKHGLCSMEAVIHGEEKEEYERHREAFLYELKPVGMMENMLAMRIVSLIWRLRRAELMQNQAIDYKIVKVCDDTHFQMSQQLLPKSIRQTFAEMRELGSHLDLGRALTRDLSNQRVIERLLMYERRIESSMFRTMRELNKLQKARKDQQALAAKEQSSQESHPPRRRRVNLKKQSQFAASRTNAKLSVIKDYGDNPPAARIENKANRSRSNSTVSEQAPSDGRISRPPGCLDTAGVNVRQAD